VDLHAAGIVSDTMIVVAAMVLVVTTIEELRDTTMTTIDAAMAAAADVIERTADTEDEASIDTKGAETTAIPVVVVVLLLVVLLVKAATAAAATAMAHLVSVAVAAAADITTARIVAMVHLPLAMSLPVKLTVVVVEIMVVRSAMGQGRSLLFSHRLTPTRHRSLIGLVGRPSISSEHVSDSSFVYATVFYARRLWDVRRKVVLSLWRCQISISRQNQPFGTQLAPATSRRGNYVPQSSSAGFLLQWLS
jgi:hypothetical protein